VRSERGFTLVEILAALALAGVLAAVSLPVVLQSINRNKVWTGSELIGTQIRQARLLAISQNARFRVRFHCPDTGQLRVLVVTGDSTIDDATDRCSQTQTSDSGIIAMPSGVTLDDTIPVLEVNGRGVYSVLTGSIPVTVNVSYGDSTRSLTVNSTGQITFDVY
jgi:prepilin-type N-terminal cleavage/methylation domain-containing protein